VPLAEKSFGIVLIDHPPESESDSLRGFLGSGVTPYGQETETAEKPSQLGDVGSSSRGGSVEFCGRPVWGRGRAFLAYVTGTVDQEPLARNEYLAAENRIIKAVPTEYSIASLCGETDRLHPPGMP